MQTLTKENFWNEVESKYPEAFAVFSKWIDSYKVEVDWNKLFNVDSDYQNAAGKNAPTPKFHELPFEFQNGIIARFDIECFNDLLTGRGKEVYENGRDGYINGINNLFADLEQQIINKQKN